MNDHPAQAKARRAGSGSCERAVRRGKERKGEGNGEGGEGMWKRGSRLTSPDFLGARTKEIRFFVGQGDDDWEARARVGQERE